MNVPADTFAIEGDRIVRVATAGSASGTTFIECNDLRRLLEHRCAGSQRLLWELLELRGYRPRPIGRTRDAVRVVDIYSGCGGFSHGARRALEMTEFVAAIDLQAIATSVHAANFGTHSAMQANIEQMVDYQISGYADNARFSYIPEIIDPAAARKLTNVDLLIASPPCQGHSNFNNSSRRTDPRNRLYLTVPAIAAALSVSTVVIENVPEVLIDKSDVVRTAKGLLSSAGYKFSDATLKAEQLGVAQTRKRHFLVASKKRTPPLLQSLPKFEMPLPTVSWAIDDLEELAASSTFDMPADVSGENQRRIDYLFDTDQFDLPNAERPDCHKDGHTYPSVYGRLRTDQPAQTITTGFSSPGQGRFIHPRQRRTITPHEAARLQGFPDYFRFVGPCNEPLSRKEYARLIGDAVPPPMAYYAVLCGIAASF